MYEGLRLVPPNAVDEALHLQAALTDIVAQRVSAEGTTEAQKLYEQEQGLMKEFRVALSELTPEQRSEFRATVNPKMEKK